MPFKSKAQRRKFAQLLVDGEITPEVFEEWNRETGRKELPERVAKKTTQKSVAPRKRRKSTKKRKSAPAGTRRGPTRRKRATPKKKKKTARR